MTVIIARKFKDRVEFVCDSQVGGDGYVYTPSNLNPQKILKGDGYAFGLSGDLFQFGLMSEYLFRKRPNVTGLDDAYEVLFDFFREMEEVKVEPVGDALIAFGSSLYWFSLSGKYVFEIEEWWAVGSGDDFAIAAIHCEKTIAEAAELACKLSSSCSLPLQTLTHTW